MKKINTNLASLPVSDKTRDFLSSFIEKGIEILIVLYPWIFISGILWSEDNLGQIALLSIVGVSLISFFLWILKRGELEWRRTRINILLLVWLAVLSIVFIYADDHIEAWAGGAGSFSGGLIEYVLFIFLFFLAVQFYSPSKWENILKSFTFSLVGALIILPIISSFFYQVSISNALEIVFLQEGMLFPLAIAGIISLVFFKTSEKKKSYAYFILSLFILSFLLLINSFLGILILSLGGGLILLFELLRRIGSMLELREKKKLNMPGSKRLVAFRGKAALLILFFFLTGIALASYSSYSGGISNAGELSHDSFLSSKSLSHKLEGKYFLLGSGSSLKSSSFFMGLLEEQGFLGLISYLSLIFIVFYFGIIHLWKSEKNFKPVVICTIGLFALLMTQIFYSQDSVTRMLMWIIFVFAGLTFIRSNEKEDWLRPIKPGQGKILFLLGGTILSAIVLAVIYIQLAGLSG